MWKCGNRVIDKIEDMPDGCVGFIYEVEHIPTGKKYIGKKVLFFERNVKIGVRERAKLKEERKVLKIRGNAPKKKKVIKESDWKTYHGSSAVMLELVKNGQPSDFKRTILQFVFSKKLLAYYETKLLFELDVLQKESEYINDNIAAKYFRRDFE